VNITKTAQAEIVKAANGKYDASFVMSAADADRVGDRFSPKAYQSLVGKKLLALYSHDHTKPIGFWENIRVQGKKLIGDVSLAPTNLGAMLKTLISHGTPLMASVGFAPKDYDVDDEGYIFKEVEWLECSIVSIGMNPEAVQVAKSLGIDPKILDCDQSDPTCASRSTSHTKPVAKTAHTPANSRHRKAPMKTADRIIELGQQLKAIDDQKLELAAKMEDDDFDGNIEEIEKQVDLLDSDREAIERELSIAKSLEDAKKQRMEQMRPQEKQATPTAPAVVKHVGDGDAKNLLGKQALVDALAFSERKSHNEIVEKYFGQDRSINAVVKTATGVADTTTSGFAAELVGSATLDFLETATNRTLFGALRGLGRSVRFNNSNSAKLTFLDRSAPTRSAFVAEGGAIPTGTAAFGEKRLEANKMGVIIPVTKELLRDSPYDVIGLFESALADFMADQLDEHLLDGAAAVSGVRPASILNGVAGNATSGATAANVVTDINTVFATLEGAKNIGTPVLAMAPSTYRSLLTTSWPSGGFSYRDELESGMLLGARVVVSDNIDATSIKFILLDASKFGWAYGNPMMETSDQATIVLASADTTAPTMAVDAAGAVGPADQVIADGGIHVRNSSAFEGGAGVGDFKAVSLWQINSVGIKAVMPIAFSMLVPNAIDQITA
jgi:HK97 family phage major capsid protein/HK97 family phage prohead protease